MQYIPKLLFYLLDQTIQEWHMFILIGVLLAIDVVYLIIVTAVPEAILRLETQSKPIIVSL